MNISLATGLREAYIYMKFPIPFRFHAFVASIEEIDADPLNHVASDILSSIQLANQGLNAGLAAIPDIFSDDVLGYFISKEAVEYAIGNFVDLLLCELKHHTPNLPLDKIKMIHFQEPSTFSLMVVGTDEQITNWLIPSSRKG